MEAKKKMNEKEKFLKEIKQHIKHKNRKFFGRVTPVMVAGLIVSAVCVGAVVLFLMHDLKIFGAITLNGTSGELGVSYDGNLLVGEYTEITCMDISEMNMNETYTFSHNFSNGGDLPVEVFVDLSNMPLEYSDVNDTWYGFAFYVYEAGTTNEVTSFVLNPGETIDINYYYALADGFIQPTDPFPFDLRYHLVQLSTGY